jgi:hypothetical protein
MIYNLFFVLFIVSCNLKEKPMAINSENNYFIQNNSNINNENLIYFYDNIFSLINKEIIINDTWAGQSFTLIYENDIYYIHRKIFGSGVPYIGTIIYNVIFDSEYRITFYEIVAISENIKEKYNRNEVFELFSISDNDISFYVNGMCLNIKEIR